jgi:hypothetical protein
MEEWRHVPPEQVQPRHHKRGRVPLPQGIPGLLTTVKNAPISPLDLGLFNLSCPGGADEVFDEDAGFAGTPEAHVLPGKSQTWKEACVFAKTAKNVQIELTPMDTSGDGWYRTGIFTGNIR